MDAWHIRHRTAVHQLSKSIDLNLSVVYLGFDDLPLAHRDKVRKIKTDFNISEREQRTLFKAGGELVASKRERIRRLVFGL